MISVKWQRILSEKMISWKFEKRDVKGLYAKARKGEIQNFTGISAPFEVPEHPALALDTSKLSLEESVNRLLEMVLPKIEKK